MSRKSHGIHINVDMCNIRWLRILQNLNEKLWNFKRKNKWTHKAWFKSISEFPTECFYETLDNEDCVLITLHLYWSRRLDSEILWKNACTRRPHAYIEFLIMLFSCRSPPDFLLYLYVIQIQNHCQARSCCGVVMVSSKMHIDFLLIHKGGRGKEGASGDNSIPMNWHGWIYYPHQSYPKAQASWRKPRYFWHSIWARDRVLFLCTFSTLFPYTQTALEHGVKGRTSRLNGLFLCELGKDLEDLCEFIETLLLLILFGHTVRCKLNGKSSMCI